MAILDTGFTGDIAIPMVVAIELGLTKAGVGDIMLADGSVTMIQLYSGKVQLGSRTYDATYFVFPSGEVLIGMGLLAQYTVCFDATSGNVSMTELEKPTRKYEEAGRYITELMQMMTRMVR
jgi:predicted aspartyl protease